MKKLLILLPVFISFAAFAQQTKTATAVSQQNLTVVTSAVVATDSVRSVQPAATAQQQLSLTLTPNTQLVAVTATAVTDTTLNMQKSSTGNTTTPGVQMLDGTRATVPAAVKATAVPVPATHDKQPK